MIRGEQVQIHTWYTVNKGAVGTYTASQPTRDGQGTRSEPRMRTPRAHTIISNSETKRDRQATYRSASGMRAIAVEKVPHGPEVRGRGSGQGLREARSDMETNTRRERHQDRALRGEISAPICTMLFCQTDRKMPVKPDQAQPQSPGVATMAWEKPQRKASEPGRLDSQVAVRSSLSRPLLPSYFFLLVFIMFCVEFRDFDLMCDPPVSLDILAKKSMGRGCEFYKAYAR